MLNADKLDRGKPSRSVDVSGEMEPSRRVEERLLREMHGWLSKRDGL